MAGSVNVRFIIALKLANPALYGVEDELAILFCLIALASLPVGLILGVRLVYDLVENAGGGALAANRDDADSYAPHAGARVGKDQSDSKTIFVKVFMVPFVCLFFGSLASFLFLGAFGLVKLECQSILDFCLNSDFIVYPVGFLYLCSFSLGFLFGIRMARGWFGVRMHSQKECRT